VLERLVAKSSRLWRIGFIDLCFFFSFLYSRCAKPLPLLSGLYLIVLFYNPFSRLPHELSLNDHRFRRSGFGSPFPCISCAGSPHRTLLSPFLAREDGPHLSIDFHFLINFCFPPSPLHFSLSSIRRAARGFVMLPCPAPWVTRQVVYMFTWLDCAARRSFERSLHQFFMVLIFVHDVLTAPGIFTPHPRCALGLAFPPLLTPQFLRRCLQSFPFLCKQTPSSESYYLDQQLLLLFLRKPAPSS